jgi:predicted phage gp36 major capsid-like protein
VQDAFGYVLFAVVIVGVIGAVATFFMSGKAYDQIGKGGFYTDKDAPSGGGYVNVAERDDEIRQMLTARNARRAAAGLEEVDVEEELARLVAPQIDAELAGEIRDHVIARNARRIRRGQEPLDVDAEVERAINELS